MRDQRSEMEAPSSTRWKHQPDEIHRVWIAIFSGEEQINGSVDAVLGLEEPLVHGP
jgi:hypothetical protein